MITAAVAAGVLLLAACGGSSSGSGTGASAGESAAASSASGSTSVSSPVAGGTTSAPGGDATAAPPSLDAIDQSPGAPPASAPTATSAAGPAATSTAAPTIILEPEGLGFLTVGTTIEHLTFADADAATITTALTKALGPLKANDLPECGQGKRSSLERADFSVLLDGTKFVGWLDQGAKGRTLTSAAGLGIGVTLAQVKKLETGVQVMNESLGPEFFAENGISGFLDGTKPTSKVTALYAGETCFFR